MATITNYFKGKACAWRTPEATVIGRIVGESDNGSWGNINGIPMFSVPLFSTPHGTVMKIGVLKLSELTEKETKQLVDFERNALTTNPVEDFYAGYITLGDISYPMNEFTRQWVISTLAPESIRNIKSGLHDNKATYVDVIKNEDGTKHVIVLSDDFHVLNVSLSASDMWNSKITEMSFADGIKKVAKLLELTNISV